MMWSISPKQSITRGDCRRYVCFTHTVFGSGSRRAIRRIARSHTHFIVDASKDFFVFLGTENANEFPNGESWNTNIGIGLH